MAQKNSAIILSRVAFLIKTMEKYMQYLRLSYENMNYFEQGALPLFAVMCVSVFMAVIIIVTDKIHNDNSALRVVADILMRLAIISLLLAFICGITNEFIHFDVDVAIEKLNK